MSLIRKHVAVLQAWACLDLVRGRDRRLSLSLVDISFQVALPSHPH